MTILQFAQRICQATGSKSEIVFESLPVDDPKTRQPDITLAREILDWSPRIALEDGLNSTIDYFRSLLADSE
jgi:nucleoside-diphosphate-sugar epimerase